MSAPFPRARDAAHRHTTIAIVFHWSIVALVVALLGLGWSMTRLAPGSELQFALYQLHKSLGVTVLLLSLLRLVWRLVEPPPPLPPGVPRWQRNTARAVQGMLLALTLALPLTGWAMVSASRLAIPTVLFGVVTWPHLPGVPDLPPATRRSLEPALATAHGVLACAMAGLAVLHAGAAIFHHAAKRDAVLWRMLPLARLRRS